MIKAEIVHDSFEVLILIIDFELLKWIWFEFNMYLTKTLNDSVEVRFMT